MLRLSNIAGFDFEKKVVLIKTGKFITNYGGYELLIPQAVHEIQSISDDEMQAIFDAWQKQKLINEEYGGHSR